MELGEQQLKGTERLHPDWVLAHEYGLSPELLAMTHVWKSTSHDYPPDCCQGRARNHHGAVPCGVRLVAAEVRQTVNAMAAEGLRVLGVAKATFTGTDWPAGQHDFDFELVGLLGLADPLRDSVPKAVAQCQGAGIRVMMITGDYPVTALAIARQAGIVDAQDDERRVVMAGDELAALSEPELAKRVRRGEGVCPHQTGAKTGDCECPENWGRGGGHDWRWRQRCPSAESRAHRHRHGAAWHRCGPRGRSDGVVGR